MSDDSDPEWVKSSRKAQTYQDLSDSPSPIRYDEDEDSGEAVQEAAADPASSKKPKAASMEQAGKGKQPKGPPATQLPLLLAPKVKQDLLLLEAVDPELDLSGDFGCIGRLHVNSGGKSAGPSSEGRGAVTLDLKGKIYEGDLVPSNGTLCVMSIDGSSAKIESAFTEYVQLSAPRVSIFDMEQVNVGEMDASFFGEGVEMDSNADSDEELGPLKEKRGGGKVPAKKQGGRKASTTKAATKRKAGGGASKPKKPKAAKS